MNLEIKEMAGTFRPIDLKDMDGVALMNRSDTKFILPKSQITVVLSSILNNYDILEVNNDRVMTYNSLYYDTPENDFYQWHHNGKVRRLKIRIRNYVESNIHFLEIKRKNGKGITQKNRISVDCFENRLSVKSKDFIQNITNVDYELAPKLVNEFNRITLVNKALKERVTIDFNLNFRNKTGKKSFENLAIIELKQEGVDRNSPIYKALKKRHILPNSISKYCLGMISLYGGIKYNAFKGKLLQIEKITA
jgi:hypothetical protein